MSPSRRFAALLLVGLTSCSVATYSTTIDEFDSITGWNIPEEEPVGAEYPDRSLQYPWYAFMLPSDGVVGAVENPSGYVRERVGLLSRYAGTDLTRIAQVTRRLLWVANRDRNPFNRILALQGIERVMRSLAIDPLQGASYSRDLEPLAQAARERDYRAAQHTLEELFRRADRGAALSSEQRASYIAALKAYTEEPLPRLRWQRALIRTLWSAYAVETDPLVHTAARDALLRAIRFAACNGLRDGLVPQEYDTDDFPSVRAEVIFIYRRLGGAAAVPFVLNLMARPQVGSLLHRYDQDPKVRRLLVRLCAQLKLPLAMRRIGGGVRGIEFLYETAVDVSEDEGVRQVALEGLWRCLADQLELPRQPVGDAWAREWWRQHVVDRSR